MTFRVLGMNRKGIPLEEAKSGKVFVGAIPTHFLPSGPSRMLSSDGY